MLDTPPIVIRLLLAAEREIALLDRCRSHDLARQLDRVVARWEAGTPVSPGHHFLPAPDLSGLRAALEEVASGAQASGWLGALYADRAAELLLEAELVSTRGNVGFRPLAARRFPGGDVEELRRAAELAAEWSSLPARGAVDPVPAEDARRPDSLRRQIQRRVDELGLPFRVVVTPHLASVAATANGVIRVRSGVSHGPRQGARIALHEVLGHALPRTRALAEPLPLFRIGSRGASADEEGYALLLEERSGLMDDTRRWELGVRHLVASAVRSGADFVEGVRLGMEHGASVRQAVELSARVCRGGGLAREIVYVPALLRVKKALSAEPELEGWLQRGRLSIDAARQLRAQAADGTDGTDGTDDQWNVATTGV